MLPTSAPSVTVSVTTLFVDLSPRDPVNAVAAPPSRAEPQPSAARGPALGRDEPHDNGQALPAPGLSSQQADVRLRPRHGTTYVKPARAVVARRLDVVAATVREFTESPDRCRVLARASGWCSLHTV
jgi:hypothetical protein